MIVEMPYGIVEINNQEQAMRFIRHHCFDCPYNSMFSACNYTESHNCDRIIKSVLLAFAPRQISYIQKPVENWI